LSPDAPVSLRCRKEESSFPLIDGIANLVRADRVDAVGSFARAYSEVWRKDGWGAPDSAYLFGLPYRDTTGRNSMKWKVKARSMDALLVALESMDVRTVVDLGAGIGWLSYHMARKGFEVYAVDVVQDSVLGLGAGRSYIHGTTYFERVCGELTNPPFQRESIDVVICNASLHYASELQETLRAISGILRPGGSFFVMNSPVHHKRHDTVQAETAFRAHLKDLGADEMVSSSYHHFERSALLSALNTLIGPTTEIPFDPGVAFRLNRRIKGIVLRMGVATFPILRARKAQPCFEDEPIVDE